MGRIKSTMIKRAAKQLLDGEHTFNSEFNHNKKLLGSTMPSKSVRNKIAGYLARIIRVKDNPKVKVKKEVQIEEVLA
ncbi:30S ribosomal protein S17e [Candidatus Pacearchaeota archaeon]|nr:30S ribosomal protein S17e [Candidatus Pacearchaeota archaeon]